MMNLVSSLSSKALRLGVAAALLATAACGSPSDPKPTTGIIALSVAGLPTGVSASVEISGPAGFDRTFTSAATVSDLAPGTYTVKVNSVTATGDIYGSDAPSPTVTVTASDTPVPVAVTYSLLSGELIVSVTGLPDSASADISVVGPNGYSATVAETDTLKGLLPGSYLAGAANAIVDGATYQPDSTVRHLTVSKGQTSTAIFAFQLQPLNLSISGMYLSQSVQDQAHSIPLVAGRDGYLRIFALANLPNSVRPPIRVRFYQGSTLLATKQVEASAQIVPTRVDESLWANSWNLLVPGSLVQQGVSIKADIDPENAVPERNEDDNVYPASGEPASLDVHTAAPYHVRLIPITQPDGTTGAITEGNEADYLHDLMALYPLQSVDADIHRPYFTTAGPVTGSDGWSQVLNEIDALRVAEGSTRYYYGILKASYSSGTVGIGYVPGKTAIGWDKLPSASNVLAHETGHNWGRQHSPCGSPSNPDPDYPYAGGVTGIYGVDVTTGTLKSPNSTDIMGYCNNVWISDYTYLGVMSYREQEASQQTSVAPSPSLLVWGRVTGGKLVLEPAFSIRTRPAVPRGGGSFLLRGFDASGGEVFRYAFTPRHVAHQPSGEGAFAFALPLTADQQRRLARISVSGRGMAAERVASAGGESAPELSVTTEGGSATVVRWDEQRHPVVMLRDALTGEIVSFARSGRIRLPLPAQRLEVVVSDGVHSRPIQPPTRLP